MKNDNRIIRNEVMTEKDHEVMGAAVASFIEKKNAEFDEWKAQQDAKIREGLESGELIEVDGRIFDAEIYRRNHNK